MISNYFPMQKPIAKLRDFLYELKKSFEMQRNMNEEYEQNHFRHLRSNV